MIILKYYMYITLCILAGKSTFGELSCYAAPTKATQCWHVHASTSTITIWGPTRWQQLWGPSSRQWPI